MNVKQAKEVLETIGYPVTSDDWDEMVDELHQEYKVTAVGGSMNTLGDAAPLFMRSGNAAHMVDNRKDLHRACALIKQIIKAREGAKPVVIKSDSYSQYLKDLKQTLDYAVDYAEKYPQRFTMTTVDDEYRILVPAPRQQIRKGQQIIDDLLSDDKKLNAKAVKAIKELMIYA